MSKKVKGILTSIVVVASLVVFSAGLVTYVTATSHDEWAGLGIFFIMVFLTGAVIIIMLITGLIFYKRKNSEFGLGITLGMVSIITITGLITIIMKVYEFINDLQ